MKIFLFICAAVLFIGVANLPVGYYTFLRIIVFIGAGIICYQEWNNTSKTWLVIFGTILVLFNPITPVYLNNKSLWIPLDIITGILFIIKSLTYNLKSENKYLQ